MTIVSIVHRGFAGIALMLLSGVGLAATLQVSDTRRGSQVITLPFPGASQAGEVLNGSYGAGFQFAYWIRPIVPFPRSDFASVTGRTVLGAKLRFRVVNDSVEPKDMFDSEVRLFATSEAPLNNSNADAYAALTGDSADYAVIGTVVLTDGMRGEIVLDLPAAALQKLVASINGNDSTIGVTLREFAKQGLDEFYFDSFVFEVTVPGPEIVAAPAPLDFGTQRFGTSTGSVVTITNPGAEAATLRVDSIALGDAPGCARYRVFALPLPSMLAPGDSVNASIVFSPVAFEQSRCELRIASDAPLTPQLSVPLVGVGDWPVNVAVPVLTPGNLDGSNGVVYNGALAGEEAGQSVSGGGDINADGIDDVIIATTRDSGAATYVVFGKPGGQPAVQELAELDGSNGFVVTADAVSFGRAGHAGDLNGDGADDLVITNGTDVAYIVFGSDGAFDAALDVSNLDGTNGFVLNDTSCCTSKRILDAGFAGDINNDGLDDLIIGNPGVVWSGSAGSIYVVYGKSTGFAPTVELSQLAGTDGFTIIGVDEDLRFGEGDGAGRSVAGAGDINGDGIHDLVIGAPSASAIGVGPFSDQEGEAYVVFGADTGFSSTLFLADLDGSDGFTINGVDANDSVGVSVAGAGDVNGDGFDDLIIGANNAGAAGQGSAYVLFGKSSRFPARLFLASLNRADGFIIEGTRINDSVAMSVDGAGDVNNDGYADIIIGAPRAQPGGITDAGQAYVLFGRGNGFRRTIALSSLDVTRGFIVNGSGASHFAGVVSRAGDVNGDGLDDVIVGASGADPNGNNSGQSYVILGAPARVGGLTPGFNPGQSARCRNLVSGQRTGIAPFRMAWDCSAAGFKTDAGDAVELVMRGRMGINTTSMTGRVSGLAPQSLSGWCYNRTSAFTSAANFSGSADWVCNAPGTTYTPGDIVDVIINGAAAE